MSKNVEMDKVTSGVYLFIGKPESGKTHQMRLLLEDDSKFFAGFDFYLLLSPSKMKGVEFNENYCCDKLDLAWLADRLTFI